MEERKSESEKRRTVNPKWEGANGASRVFPDDILKYMFFFSISVVNNNANF